MKSAGADGCRRARKGKKKYLKVVQKVKRRARSELRRSRGDWSRYEYASTYSKDGLGLREDAVGDYSMEYVDASKTTFAEFAWTFEKKGVPCVIRDACVHWPAMRRWGSGDSCELFEKYKNLMCKVGSDDDGYAVRMKLKHFLQYAKDPEQGGADDSPLYVFDGGILQKTDIKSDYTVPCFFAEDLLKYAGESRRPPYKWLCIGPARSGTSVHVDPLRTSAWNALIRGEKRWAFFPPDSVPEHVLKPKGVTSAMRWFDVVWPQTQDPAQWKSYPKPIDVIQKPGEVIFVPSGWWHVVLNLDFTVAVTHNFCSSANFDRVFMHCRVSRPKMAIKWVHKLHEVAHRPDLVARAQNIISKDLRCESVSSPSSSSSSSDSEVSSCNNDNKKKNNDSSAESDDTMCLGYSAP
jgi:histone arginine demethylase JMJD6